MMTITSKLQILHSATKNAQASVGGISKRFNSTKVDATAFKKVGFNSSL